MGYLGVEGGTEPAKARAALLAAKGMSLDGLIGPAVAEAEAIDSTPIEGTDKYGKAFNAAYRQATGDGELNRVVQKMLRDLGPEAEELGNTMSTAMTRVNATDLYSKHLLGEVGIDVDVDSDSIAAVHTVSNPTNHH
jgi:hypothetical protein